MTAETQPTLTDEDIETVWHNEATVTATTTPQDADGADADGTDGDAADGTDGDAADGTDGDAADSADGDAGDADGQDA